MEYLHTIIILIIIGVIIYFQLRVFFSTKNKLSVFQNIFPPAVWFNIEKNEETGSVMGIRTECQNPILKVITKSISSYLWNNRGAVSDYHIIKDIVDRNCDSVEEEINTQIPIPLYYGLMGTMAGIFVGVLFLVGSGGLSDLLGNSINGKGAQGVEALLWGVALAMISSIAGILLTTIGSSRLKDSKLEVERTKNNFLSWIQAELLPQLSTDTTATLEKMTRNLSSFNSTFSTNTKELRETLSLVNDSYRGQAEVLETISRLKINNIATANIAVYDKLKNCTDEIGQFATYLNKVNGYISNVNALNDKLDEHENRTKAIEDMGIFFREERANMERWNAVLSETTAKADRDLSNAVEALKDSIKKQFDELSKHTIKQREGFEKTVDEQQEILLKRTTELDIIISEIQNLSAVKTSMDNLGKTSAEQNRKMGELTSAIHELAEIKTDGGNPITRYKVPRWLKISSIVVVLLLIIPNIIYILSLIISLFKA